MAGVLILKLELEEQNQGCAFFFRLSRNRSILFQDKLDTSLKYDDFKKNKKVGMEKTLVSRKCTARKALQDVLFILKDRL